MNTILSYLQEAAIRDKNGNCRCPWCGRYRKRSEFPAQSGYMNISDGKRSAWHIHLNPKCCFCSKKKVRCRKTEKIVNAWDAEANGNLGSRTALNGARSAVRFSGMFRLKNWRPVNAWYAVINGNPYYRTDPDNVRNAVIIGGILLPASGIIIDAWDADTRGNQGFSTVLSGAGNAVLGIGMSFRHKKMKISIKSRYPVFFRLVKDDPSLPEPVEEFKFHPTRRWRIDLCWPDQKLALEIEGGIWSNGRHVRPTGFLGDLEKYNRLAILGYSLLRATPRQMESCEAYDFVREWFRNNAEKGSKCRYNRKRS